MPDNEEPGAEEAAPADVQAGEAQAPVVDPGEIGTTNVMRHLVDDALEVRIVDPGEIGTVVVTKRDQTADVKSVESDSPGDNSAE